MTTSTIDLGRDEIIRRASAAVIDLLIEQADWPRNRPIPTNDELHDIGDGNVIVGYGFIHVLGRDLDVGSATDCALFNDIYAAVLADTRVESGTGRQVAEFTERLWRDPEAIRARLEPSSAPEAVADGQVVWREPPAARIPADKSVGVWERRLAPLMDQPGRWALVAEFTDGEWAKTRASAYASQLRSRKLRVPDGLWEFADATHDDRSGSDLYARYLGPGPAVS